MNAKLVDTKTLTTMTLFTISEIPLLKKYKRKSNHKDFVYNRMLETRNKAVRMLLKINCMSDVKDIKKARRRKSDKETDEYFFCRITKEDLHLLQEAKKYLHLSQKYRRRLRLLKF